MNRNQMNNSDMDPGKIDRILATEEELIPSSGFLASVMERVHEEARMPAPLPFPWKRAIPGIVLAAGVFGWGAFEFVRQALPAAREITFTQPHISISIGRPLEQAGWVAMALAVSLVSWLLARRLAGQSGLL
ncbi:MAG: hypothetical protein ACLQGT_04330 [Terracidiphilus sp.]